MVVDCLSIWIRESLVDTGWTILGEISSEDQD